jgi:hypothetical protein
MEPEVQQMLQITCEELLQYLNKHQNSLFEEHEPAPVQYLRKAQT